MNDSRFVSSYPDHGSPVRRAREIARGRMPCSDCGADGEPALRSPRPFSPAWKVDPGTYFGCPSCGHVLARLSGPSANRPSDMPSDRLPLPSGLLQEAFLPALGGALGGWLAGTGDDEALVRELESAAEASATRLGIPVLRGLRLPGRVTLVPSFVLAGLGSPWLVAFCEVPGDAPAAPESTVVEVLGIGTVETVVIVSVIEDHDTARIRLRLIGPDGEDPVPLEGSPVPVRRRRGVDR